MRKVIVITGGTKGIGRALVEKFAAERFDIVTCARNTKDLMTLKQSIEKTYYVTLYGYTADLSSVDQIKIFTHHVNKIESPIEVLINNTGSYLKGKLLEEPNGALENMININLYSAYYTTRGLIDGIKKSSNGSIFNICSVAGIKPFSDAGSYTISKFAMVGFSKVLREELKPHNIRVITVLPGATYTGSWEGSTIDSSRFIRPTDVADAIFSAYKLSPQAVVEEILIRPQLGDI